MKKKIPRYKPKTKKPKTKTEFSKKWLIACVAVSIFYTTLSYILAWCDKNALETLSTEIIEVLWGTSGISFVGYALQNCCRAYTSSKFGLPENKSRSRKQKETEEITEETEAIK